MSSAFASVGHLTGSAGRVAWQDVVAMVDRKLEFLLTSEAYGFASAARALGQPGASALHFHGATDGDHVPAHPAIVRQAITDNLASPDAFLKDGAGKERDPKGSHDYMYLSLTDLDSRENITYANSTPAQLEEFHVSLTPVWILLSESGRASKSVQASGLVSIVSRPPSLRNATRCHAQPAFLRCADSRGRSHGTGAL